MSIKCNFCDGPFKGSCYNHGKDLLKKTKDVINRFSEPVVRQGDGQVLGRAESTVREDSVKPFPTGYDPKQALEVVKRYLSSCYKTGLPEDVETAIKTLDRELSDIVNENEMH